MLPAGINAERFHMKPVLYRWLVDFIFSLSYSGLELEESGSSSYGTTSTSSVRADLPGSGQNSGLNKFDFFPDRQSATFQMPQSHWNSMEHFHKFILIQKL